MSTRIAMCIVFALLCSTPLLGQFRSDDLQVFNDSQTITIAAATVDTNATRTPGIHVMSVQWKFGTVTGTYSTCTVQAKTTFNGSDYLTLGGATAVTVTTGTVNAWSIAEPLGTSVSSTAAQSGRNPRRRQR